MSTPENAGGAATPDAGAGLPKRIRAGEDSFLELKEVVFAGREIGGPRRESLANELAAFDEQPVGSASFDDLDPALIDRFRTERSDDNRLTLAHKLGIATRTEADGYVPTVAGILLCARRPERWLRNAWIQAVAYHGRDVPDALNASIYQLDAEDITGPLDAQIAAACRFVTRNQKVRGIKTIGRTDIPQYDLTSIFEAVVNAAAHRDYSLHGSKIRLRLFSDRIELYSPGGLANALELDMLPHRQATRNEAVTSLLARIPVPRGIAGLDTTRDSLMDRRGEGVGVLVRRSEAHAGKRPVYRLLGEAEPMLTIFAAHPVVERPTRVGEDS